VGSGTVENRADETTNKRGLLRNVLVSHNLQGIGIIGIRRVPGFWHGLDVYGEGGLEVGEKGKCGELVFPSRPRLISNTHLPGMRLTIDCTGRCVWTLAEFSESGEFADALA